MSVLPVNRDITNALLELLRATPLAVGDGEQPDGAGWQGPPGASGYVGFVMLVRSGGATRAANRGTLSHPDSDAVTLYELHSIGATRDQSELVADIARNALVGRTVTGLPGRAVQAISVESFGGSVRDDTTAGEPSVWITAELVAVSSTPRAD